LARAPSNECGRCLVTKLGLAQFTARRLLSHKWRDDGCTAFDVFDAAPTHKAALLYSRPICTTRHDAMTVAACCRELRMTMVAVRPMLMAYMLMPAVSVGRRDESSGREQGD